MPRFNRKSYRRAAVAWALLTAALLLMPGSEREPEPPMWEAMDTVFELAAHFVLYLVLAWLVARSVSRVRESGRHWVAGLLVYCVALEVGQYFIPFRGVEALDVVFGFLGVWLGWRHSGGAGEWRGRAEPGG